MFLFAACHNCPNIYHDHEYILLTSKNILHFYRNIFSPTESIESPGTASVKTVEFIPVKEKIKMIAAQQEELMRKEEASKTQGGSSQAETKQKGVRILPPSPVTVRKMMVEEELHHYDTAVTRTTPTVEMMDSRLNTLERRREEVSVTPLSMVSGVSVPGWNTPLDILEQCKQKYEVDQAFEQLVAESQQTSSMVQSSSSNVQSSAMVTSSSSSKTMTAAEECRRSFEQAELEAMALDSSSCASYSKQSSMVDTQSVQSFVYQSGTTVQQQQQQTRQQSEQVQQNNVTQKLRSNSAASFERSNSRNSNNSDDISRSRKTLRCGG